VAASMAAVREAVPAASPRDGTAVVTVAPAASAGRTASSAARRALTKWAFPSTKANETQESSQWAGEARARNNSHKEEQCSSSPSVVAQARSKGQAARGSRGTRSRSGIKQAGMITAWAT
jgi:hypothetical protein